MKTSLPSLLRFIEWKLLAAVFIVSFLLPAILVGTFIAAQLPEGVAQSLDFTGGASVGLALLILFPPLIAGALVGRFANSLPQMQSVGVALLGWAFFFIPQRQSLLVMLVALAAYIALSLSGSTFGFRLRPR